MTKPRTHPSLHRVACVVLAACLITGLGGVATASSTEDVDDRTVLETDSPAHVDAADVDPCRTVLQPVVDEAGVPLVVPSCSVA